MPSKKNENQEVLRWGRIRNLKNREILKEEIKILLKVQFYMFSSTVQLVYSTIEVPGIFNLLKKI
jgi:hypothetical protein